VTGRSGDGGIDGIGILRLQRVVSFQVLFQCKRWQGTVGPKEIRDFRGAMVGRSDKGLFLTTGSFSRAAQEEATRDGAPPIDLIDGERLADLLKDLRLGVQTEMIEKVDVNEAWFDSI
jgi:restriction system protein